MACFPVANLRKARCTGSHRIVLGQAPLLEVLANARTSQRFAGPVRRFHQLRRSEVARRTSFRTSSSAALWYYCMRVVAGPLIKEFGSRRVLVVIRRRSSTGMKQGVCCGNLQGGSGHTREHLATAQMVSRTFPKV